jgi:hypothetical protein
MEEREMARVAIAVLGALVESYCQEGYADPTMYQALGIVERIARDLGDEELLNRIVLTKMFAGEVIEKLIAENQMDEMKGVWS